MQPLATRPIARGRPARAALPLLRMILFVVALVGATSAGATALDWNVELSPAGEVFPALELSQSAVADPATGNGLLRVRIAGDGSTRAVRLTVTTAGLVATSVIEAEVSADTVLRPRLQWDVRALRALTAARRQTLQVTLERAGMPTLERRIEVRVHPLDEALYFVRDGEARIDLGWAFAAWVDPHDPVVDEVLDLARAAGDIDLAQAAGRDGRLAQARAIWVALEQRGLRYSNDGAGISQGPVIYSQRVRLLADTWDERVANCLDGSVLIASALERLGVRTMLVLVPGHAFVGFYTDAGGRHAEFLETTLLGHRAPQFSRNGPESARRFEARAGAGFEAARAAGQARYQRAAARLDGRHRPNYAVIDISTARTYGIMPLAVGRGDSTRDAPAASPLAADQRTQRTPSP